jgi:DNA-binding XRE family transcriptional regulator
MVFASHPIIAQLAYRSSVLLPFFTNSLTIPRIGQLSYNPTVLPTCKVVLMFSERLKALRDKAGLSQSQLARASGVPVWTVRGYEQGRREPLWNVLFKLADALGVSVDEFRDCVQCQQDEVKPVPKRPRRRPKKP